MMLSNTKVAEKTIIPCAKAPMLNFDPNIVYPIAIIIVIIVRTIVIIMNNMNFKVFWKLAKRLIYRLIKMFLFYLIPALLLWSVLRTPFASVSNFISGIFFHKEHFAVDLTILFLLCLVIMVGLAYSGIITFHRRRDGIGILKYFCLHFPAWLFAWMVVILCQIPSFNFFLIQHGILPSADNVATAAYANQQWLVMGVLILGPIIFISFSNFGRCINRHFHEKTSARFIPKDIRHDTKALKDWLEYEAPIESPDQDVCNHKIISRRIANILLHPSNKKLKKIGLCGSYGSGKSSVLNLLSYYLQHPNEVEVNWRENDFIVCTISAWGQHNDSAVSEFVLEQVVKVIEREFNCLELVGLPKTYQAAISASDSEYGKFFAALLMPRLSPEDALMKLDRLLYDVGRKLVIYLEDCDRNHDQHQFWLEISTLLDRIGNLHNVSFVFAVGEMKETFEILTKITDHTEIMPKIPKGSFNLILKNFLTLCKVDFSNNGSNISTANTMSKSCLGIQYDIFEKLMPYPRQLKKVFGDVFRTWEMLENEINFEDLFLVCVLKVEAPKVYSFIGDYIDLLRNGGYLVDKRDWLRKILTAWKDTTGEDLETIDVRNKRFSLEWDIIQYLFPSLKEINQSARYSRESIPLNGIANNCRPTDYWVRLHAGEISSEEIRDSETKKVIEEIKAGQYDNAVAKIVENEIWGEKIRQFGEDFFKDQFHIQEIVDKIITALIKKNQLQPCTFINDCHLAMGKIIDLNDYTASFDNERYVQWLLKVVREAMGYNILFSNEFYFQWFRILKNGNEDFENNIISVIKETFSNNSEFFLNSLKRSKHNQIPNSTLTRLLLSPSCYTLHEYKYSSWRFLIPVIMDAAVKDKDLIIPQIADLIFRIFIPDKAFKVSVELREWNIELFGSHYKDALQLVHEYDFKNENQRLCEAFLQCRSKAQEVLFL